MTTTASVASILDGNSFSADAAASLDPERRDLVERRERSLGPSYRLFYRDPVLLVRAEGCLAWDADGREYLDMYNNVASLGHCHPHVVAEVSRQVATLNTHTRYLQRQVVDYSERLLATFGSSRERRVMFTNSGSEANDLGLRVAEWITGGTGFVVTAEAYHGTTALMAEISPAIQPSFVPGGRVEVVPAPDPYRNPGVDLGEWFAREVDAAFSRLEARGIKAAAFIGDSLFSSDGIFPDPVGYLRPVIDTVHRHGALYLADEVQPGFARLGDVMWGYQRHGIEPDLVSLGKPMGNGVPIGGLVGLAEHLDRFGRDVPYFNTFGGSSVPIAAASAVLDVIEGDGLRERNGAMGARMRATLDSVASSVDIIGDVRGSGMYWGAEIVESRDSALADSTAARAIVNGLREAGVLISIAGPQNNVLKIRPTFAFGDDELQRFGETFHSVVTAVAGR